jgi:formylglycine-generating enzyme required for sulfatase activity
MAARLAASPPRAARRFAAALVASLAVAGTIAGGWAVLPSGVQSEPVDLVRVTLGADRALYVGRTEVTLRQWAVCHAEGGCSLELRARSDAPDYPATGISHVDAQEYLAWINAKPGPDYRLPSRAEWYYLADEVLPETPDPIFTAPELRWASAYLVEAPGVDRALRPTGAFSTTAAGLRDLDGNVWEWTQDCHDGTGPVPEDGRCPAYIMGGLHETVMPYLTRDPASGGCASGLPPAHLGFRIVTETAPDAPV